MIFVARLGLKPLFEFLCHSHLPVFQEYSSSHRRQTAPLLRLPADVLMPRVSSGVNNAFKEQKQQNFKSLQNKTTKCIVMLTRYLCLFAKFEANQINCYTAIPISQLVMFYVYQCQNWASHNFHLLSKTPSSKLKRLYLFFCSFFRFFLKTSIFLLFLCFIILLIQIIFYNTTACLRPFQKLTDLSFNEFYSKT